MIPNLSELVPDMLLSPRCYGDGGGGGEAGSPWLHNRQMINAGTGSQRVKVHVNVRELVRTYTLIVLN